MLLFSNPRILFMVGSCLLLSGCQPEDRPEVVGGPRSDSHQEMIDILQRKKSQQADSVFFGDRQLRMAQQMLAQLPASGSAIQRIYALQMIGEEQLKHGRTQLALESQLAALKLLDEKSDQLAEDEQSLTRVEVKMLFLVVVQLLGLVNLAPG